MFPLTKQERLVLITIGLVLLTGIVSQFVLSQAPAISHWLNIIDSDELYPKTDLNRATAEELVAIPYIGEVTASNIIAYRNRYGPFKKVDEILSVKGIKDKNYKKFRRYLKISASRSRYL